MGPKLSILLRSALIAFDELRRDFGLRTTVSILGEVARRNAKGAPYRNVTPPADEKERETRDEMAPAINLYHVLQTHLPETDALATARRIILNSALIQLRSIYPTFEGGDFTAVGTKSAEELTESLNTEFAFADTKLVEMTPDVSSFDVVCCRIPAALAAADASPLASIFCEVDAIYFPIFEPAVKLERTQTIIRGGEICDFRLTWREADEPQ